METNIVDIKVETPRHLLRNMPEADWIDIHSSGTLRKNKRLKMSWRKQYLHERTNWEFGNGFELVPRSKIMFGDAFSESDCKPITEAGWFFDRYLTINQATFPEEHCELKYITVSNDDGSSVEGVGIVFRNTVAKWIPTGHILYCLITEFDVKTKQFLPASNPL